MSPIRRRLHPLVISSALLLAPACNKDDEPAAASGDQTPSAPEPTPAPKPQAPAPPPAPLPAAPSTTQDSPRVADIGEVVASLHIPTGTQMADLAAIAEMVQPNISTLLEMQAPAVLEKTLGVELAGAELSGPMSLVVVDPVAHQEPFALLVSVSDGATLGAAAEKAGRGYEERDGFALIGPKDVVAVTRDYAFANLAAARDHSELIIYPGALLTAAEPMIDDIIDQAAKELKRGGTDNVTDMLEAYGAAAEGLVEQTERIVVSVSPGQSGGDLNLHFYPKPDSTLAGFIGAQTVSDHALLTKLPRGGEHSIVISGELHSGPAHQAFVDFMAEFSAKIYETELDDQAWAKLMIDWIDTLDGRIAVLADASGMLTGEPELGLDMILGARDGAQMRTVWRELMTAFVAVASKDADAKLMGMAVSASFEPAKTSHDGVEIDVYESTVDLSQLPAEQRAAFDGKQTINQGMEFGTFDDYGAMASTVGGDGLAPLIDAARGKAEGFAPSGKVAAALSEATTRGESLVYLMDLATLAPPDAGPVSYSLFSASAGRAGEALSLRLSLRK